MDLKKSLRIEFVGEDGVDAGGLRKEWFLLLVRQLFDPQYGNSARMSPAPRSQSQTQDTSSRHNLTLVFVHLVSVDN
jgi:hypothetical protein